MRFDILGSLRIRSGADGPAVTAGRDRIVLSMLLLHAGHVVGVDELVDAVWESAPPVTARGQLQTCVSRLRRQLPGAVIVTDPAGYAIQVGGDDLDAAVFTRLAAAARVIAGAAPDDARRLYRQALDLWRGPALAGLDSPAVRQGAAVLDEQYAVAVEDWADLELAAGRHRELISELTGLVERHPLRERLRAQLMSALCGADRQADALAEYHRIQVVLRDELGVEPGVGLQNLFQSILGHGTREAVGAHPSGSTRNRGVGPVRCLPRTVNDFTGRRAAVQRLLRGLDHEGGTGPATRLIDGMAGSGKTTLALHVAALVGDRYPDAHLYIDLHGHSERQPVESAAALTILLRQLGVDGQRIPADLEERVALWRTELAGRRVLVLLDNAASAAQLTPLLPAASGCLALVTSRRRLAGIDGVSPESVDVMSEVEAVDLLGRIVGDRVVVEQVAAAELARRCGLLPLAIRLAGARLAHRPAWRVADLLERLGRVVLPELAVEDRTVASAFALSFGQLDEPSRRLFRMLGLYPAVRFDALAIAALVDLPLDAVERQLAGLVDVHLVEEPELGLFRMHDLVREFAIGLAAEMPDEGRRLAVERLLDFHLHAFFEANTPQSRTYLVEEITLPATARPDLLAALGDHLVRLERERPNLALLMEAAVRVGRPEYGWLLARLLWRLLWNRGYNEDLMQLHRRALQLAREAHDDVAVAMTANYLASAYHRLADYAEAARLLQESVQLWRKAGRARPEGTAMGNLAIVYEATGRLHEAYEAGAVALQIGRRHNVTGLIGLMLSLHSGIHAVMGRPAEAFRCLRLRLLVAVEQRDPIAIGLSLYHLAVLKRRAGTNVVVGRMLTATMRLYRTVGYQLGEAEVHNERGVLCREQGRFSAAVDEHRAALEIVTRIDDLRHQAIFSTDLAVTLARSGDLAAAGAQYQRSLELAPETRQPYEHARARAGLAECLVEIDPVRARQNWRRALDIFRRMGVPERLEVERRLAEMDRGADQLHEAAVRDTTGA